MISLGLGELADLVGGVVHDGDPDRVVDGPAFLDSRSPEPGGLFIALVGEHVDGHAYAAAAVAGGAAAVLGSRPTGVPTVVVDDAQAALQQLARLVLARRRDTAADGFTRPGISVVAITGSQGKTSAKDLLAAVLADHAPTVATAGSFNNELGLPLTVLRLTDETRYLVLEMGARGIGHLRDLCEVAPPDVALVLNVGKAHLGEFGSQANIALAKGEIVEALDPARGTAVLNGDDPLVTGMDARSEGVATVRFGRAAGDRDVRLSAVEVDDLGRPSFDLHHGGTTAHVSLRLLGAHQAANAAAVAAVGVALGLPLGALAAGLARVERLSRWRMELNERADGLTVLNDAYNANPDSVRAALETLGGIGSRSGRPTVAVLGEMRELGPDADAEHAAVGRLAADLGVDHVVVVGDGARAMLDGVGDGDTSASYAATVEEAVAAVNARVRHNDAGATTSVVLVKASRAAGLERVAATLTQPPARASTEGEDQA